MKNHITSTALFRDVNIDLVTLYAEPSKNMIIDKWMQLRVFIQQNGKKMPVMHSS